LFVSRERVSNGRDADHRKRSSSVVAPVCVAGVTYQRPLFTESPLNNGSVRRSIVEIPDETLGLETGYLIKVLIVFLSPLRQML
jgi:hypothetical protein